MNWYAVWKSDENGAPALATLITNHHWLGEYCEMVGLCAIPEARENLIIGIGKWLDSRAGMDTQFADLCIFPEDARLVELNIGPGKFFVSEVSVKVYWNGWYWKGSGQDLKSAVQSARNAKDGISCYSH